jgi:signal peptidase I
MIEPQNESPKPHHSRSRTLLEYAVTVVVAIVIALAVQAYIVKPYRVPTPSMANTVRAGDRVLIDRFAYGHRDIDRGDIVVFKGGPAVGNQVLLKRVVGLPGDVLSIENGRLLVNGQPADDGYVRKMGEGPEPTQPGPAGPDAPWSLQAPYKVPEGHYFVLGDNRTDSFDSRFWGPVPREALIGRAMAVYWPIPGIRGLN